MRHQGAWPSSRGALDDWSAQCGVAVGKLSGPLDAVLDAAAAALEAAGEPAPSRRFVLTGRQLDLTLPAPEGLPQREPREKWTEELCVEALMRCYRDVPGRRKLTQRFYTSWPPGAHNAPPLRAIQRFGSFAELRDEAHRRLGR